jgi:predicted phage terminase large subunit-like protein
MGSQAFSAQYQQAPVPPGGALIQWAWFRTCPTRPAWRSSDQIVQSWDTASKAGGDNDWSVCTTWLIRGKDYYLLDVLRRRLEYPDLRRSILAHAQAHKASTVLIEDAGSGTHLIQDLGREGKLRPIAIRPDGEKIVRMEAQSAVIEAGHVLIPETAAWLGDFQTEIMAFPYGRHDDQVDSVSQFLTWATKRQSYVMSDEAFANFVKMNRALSRPSPWRFD